MVQPDLIITPFGENANPGTINEIPETLGPSDPVQSASWNTGFPQVTMTPLSAGGIPPRGQDVNGALRAISRHVAFIGGGGQYKWSSAYVAKYGGYGIGDVIQANDGLNSYVSLVDANTTDFNSAPASIGVSWQLYSGSGLIQRQATETLMGIIRIATNALALAGANDTTAMTPLKVRQALDQKLPFVPVQQGGGPSQGTNKINLGWAGSTFKLAVDGVDVGDVAFQSDISFLEARIIGIGQTWQNVTSSRTKGTTYTNNTQRPIQIFINFDPDGNLSVLTISGQSFNVPDSQSEFISAIIPVGGTYSLSAWGVATPIKWLELR